jgi:phosphate transport system substrate-binding protein
MSLFRSRDGGPAVLRPSMRATMFAWITILSALGATPAFAAVVHGAGATFPAPVYLRWAAAYREQGGATIDYDAVGSAEGIARIKAGTVDFGATDRPLTDDELRAADLIQFPVVIGGVVPVVNIPGVKPAALRMSGPLLADIYLGRIGKWNDPAIAALNPELSLPNVNITLVHRMDGSGTTFLFTRYLSLASTAWNDELGAALSVRWPAGIGGTGNEGVASYVQRTRFSLGYVEYTYARNHHLADVSLRDDNGDDVVANVDSFRAAAQTLEDAPSQGAQHTGWPIAGMSYIVLRPDKEAAVSFFRWAIANGASIALDLDYVPLPEAVRERVLRSLSDPVSVPHHQDSGS